MDKFSLILENQVMILSNMKVLLNENAEILAHIKGIKNVDDIKKQQSYDMIEANISIAEGLIEQCDDKSIEKEHLSKLKETKEIILKLSDKNISTKN